MWPELVVRKDGRVAATDAFVIAFFIDVEHRLAAAGVAASVDRFVSFVTPARLPLYLDEEGEPQPLDAASYRALRARLIGSATETGEGGIRLIGDERDLTGVQVYYYGEALPNDALPRWRNVLTYHISRGLFLEYGAREMRGLLHRLAAGLSFSFAYANPCIQYDINVVSPKAFARRFPGIDVLSQGAAATTIGDQAAGVYWLSIFGRNLTRAVGGAAALRQLLPEAAAVDPLPEEHMELLLTAEPEVGDVNRKLALPIHRKAAALLAEHLHIPEVVYFFEPDGITPDREAMVAWHRRFLD